MKKTLFIFLLLTSFIIFAQETQPKFKCAEQFNKGNVAIKSGDYKTAIDCYKMFLDSNEITEVHASKVYVLATAYLKNNDNVNALKYYKKALELNYSKPEKAYLSIAKCYENMKDDSNKIVTIMDAYQKFPTDETISSILFTHYKKVGVEKYKTGANIVKVAFDKYAKKDKAKFVEEVVRANEEFKKALEFLNKAREINQADQDVIKLIDDIENRKKEEGTLKEEVKTESKDKEAKTEK